MQNEANLSKYQLLKRYFSIAMVVLLSVSAVLGIGIVVFGKFSIPEFKILGTTVTLGIFALLMSGNVARLSGRPLVRRLAWVALVVDSLVTLYIILGIWGVFSNHCSSAEHYDMCYKSWQEVMNFFHKFFWVGLNVAFSLSIIGRFLTYEVRQLGTKVVCYLTMACTIVLAIVFMLLIICDIRFNDTLLKLIIVLCILLVLGLIVTPILIRLEQKNGKQRLGEE